MTAQELVDQLALLDSPCCCREDGAISIRFDCIDIMRAQFIESWSTCDFDMYAKPARHSERCRNASRAQRRGYVWEHDEFWRRHAAWQQANGVDPITYADWLAETGETDARFAERQARFVGHEKLDPESPGAVEVDTAKLIPATENPGESDA